MTPASCSPVPTGSTSCAWCGCSCTELANRGVTDLMIGVMEDNDGARRLYERRGLIQGWRQLYRVSAAKP